MIDPSRVRMTGPLAPFTAGFAVELQRRGYIPTPHAYRFAADGPPELLAGG